MLALLTNLTSRTTMVNQLYHLSIVSEHLFSKLFHRLTSINLLETGENEFLDSPVDFLTSLTSRSTCTTKFFWWTTSLLLVQKADQHQISSLGSLIQVQQLLCLSKICDLTMRQSRFFWPIGRSAWLHFRSLLSTLQLWGTVADSL